MNTVHSLQCLILHLLFYSANTTTFYICFKLNDSKPFTSYSRYVHWPTNTEWLDFLSTSHTLIISYVCFVTFRQQYILVERCCSGALIRVKNHHGWSCEVVKLRGKNWLIAEISNELKLVILFLIPQDQLKWVLVLYLEVHLQPWWFLFCALELP